MNAPCQVDGCGNPTGTGLAICPNCTNRLKNALAEIPGLWIDLRVTMGRQKAATYNGATAASRETPLPVHLPALLARDYLAATVRSWTRETGLLTGKPCTYDDVPSMARWLGDTPNFGTLTRSSAAADAVDELTAGAITEARRVIDTPPGRIYAGPCNSLGALQSDGTPRLTDDSGKPSASDSPALHAQPTANVQVTGGEQAPEETQVLGCGATLHVPENDRYSPTVKCGTCGSTYDQQTRRRWVAAQYVGLYVTVAEASTLLGETRKTLQQRIRRNQIKPRSTPLLTPEARFAAAYLLDDLTTERIGA